MRKLFTEFKEFAVKGNVVEIAIGLILALVFQAVVKSLVDDILMQVVAAIFGQPDFGGLVIDLGDAEIRYGAFLNTIINFVLVAFALFIFVVKPYNAMKARQEAEQEVEEQAPAEPPEDITLLREIRDALRR